MLSDQVATIDRPAPSPSGEYTLHVDSADTEGELMYKFYVLDSEERVVYECPDTFDVRHTTYFLWDDKDRVWVYSGDLGTFFWELDPHSGMWQRFTYAESDVPAPEFLKEVRPQWHEQ